MYDVKYYFLPYFKLAKLLILFSLCSIYRKSLQNEISCHLGVHFILPHYLKLQIIIKLLIYHIYNNLSIIVSNKASLAQIDIYFAKSNKRFVNNK